MELFACSMEKKCDQRHSTFISMQNGLNFLKIIEKNNKVYDKLEPFSWKSFLSHRAKHWIPWKTEKVIENLTKSTVSLSNFS